MSRALLGVPFDVHGGGFDLIFPHHENEIAQSEALMPAPPMAETWVHGGLLNFDGRKMSKSLGNFEPLSALLDRHDPLAIRLLFLGTGYRKPMNFTEDAIAGAKSALERLRRGYAILAGEIPNPTVPAAGGEPASAYEARFFEALDDDMNTAGAAGVLFEMVSSLPRHPDPAERAAGAALLRDALGLFGIAPLLERPVETDHVVELDPLLVERLAARLGGCVHLNGDGPEAAVQAIIDARTAARKNKDFALGDRLRDALAAEGIVLKDSKDGTTWTVADA
jgi:cysteinyl-tRNA synthetase